MKGVILLGGYGTRLRPLTVYIPKALVEFANKPMILHQLEALRDAGCREVVLAVAYHRQVMEASVQAWQEQLGIRIVVSEEGTPLGTAGPLALARDVLQDDSGAPFFLLNGDVMCPFPLQKMLQFHQACNAEITLLVTEVPDPTRFGVVVSEKNKEVTCFVEKPSSFLGAKVNAGVYVIQPSVLDRIQIKPTSLEREILPAVAGQVKLYAMPLNGYWKDIGQPEDYLHALEMHLEHERILRHVELAQGDCYEGNVLIGRNVTIGANCRIGPNVCIGNDCVIGDSVRLKNCAVMHRTTVRSFSLCMNTILGWNCVIGKWCRLENGCTFGEHVTCQDELMFNGATVLPHKSLSQSVMKPEIIL